jgi:hypothetical protein
MTQTYAEIWSTIKNSRWAWLYSGLDVRSDRESSGEELYKCLSSRGLVSDWRELSEVPVGGELAIGMTTYRRIS